MTEKQIVITGVSRGLGAALTEEFVSGGHTVSGCTRSPEAALRLKKQFGNRHRFDVVDVSADDQVGAWAKQLLDEDRIPDLLLNNAAIINENANLWETSPEEFSSVVDINVKGTYHVTRHFLPAMIDRGRGVIVNFSSAWGRSTSPQVATYCATKWAIEGMTRALAEELPFGLAAIPLNPGVIHTEMLDSCLGSSAANFPLPAQWAKKAAPFLLELNQDDNGDPLTAPT